MTRVSLCGSSIGTPFNLLVTCPFSPGFSIFKKTHFEAFSLWQYSRVYRPW